MSESIASRPVKFGVSEAYTLALQLTPRRTGEHMGIYAERVDAATRKLLAASHDNRTRLHRQLHVLHRFTPPAAQAGTLRDCAAEALQRAA